MFGRVDLALLVEPFRPHEAALLLPRLPPAEQAAVWGLVGGVPLYLDWWDDGGSIRKNLERLVCAPGAPLLTAGELSLAWDLDAGDLARQVVYAISAGKTKHNEIADTIRADPTRVLERLTRIGVVERLIHHRGPQAHPTPDLPAGRQLPRVLLTVVDRHRDAIERGLGRSVLPVMVSELDDFLGGPWEEALRIHLRRMAGTGALGPDVVAVGRYWTAANPPVEIDGLVLAGRRRTAVAVAEAKWARRVDGARIGRELARTAAALPHVSDDLQLVVAAREHVSAEGVTAVTAEDVFGS